MKDAAGEIARECLALRARMLNRVISAAYDETLAPLELKASQLNLLVAVALHRGARPAELCARLRLDESTLSRNVERMRRRGWLRLGPGDDRRSHRIAITRQGRALLARAYAAWNAAQTQLGRRLGADGRAALRTLVERLL